MQIVKSRQPLNQLEIRNTEKKINANLPLSYKNFLMAHNGGQPIPNAYPIANCPVDTHGLVHFFFCICEGDMYDLIDYVDTYHNRLPEYFLPIACDPGGNLICLVTAGPQAGKVYFWDHEEELTALKTYANVYLIAESFDEFLESLMELP